MIIPFPRNRQDDIPDKWYYSLERFDGAFCVLVTGNEPLKSRIYSAYLIFHPVRPENFPDQISLEMYEEIMKGLTKFTATGKEGDIHATLEKISDHDAGEIALKIIQLQQYLERKIYLNQNCQALHDDQELK